MKRNMETMGALRTCGTARETLGGCNHISPLSKPSVFLNLEAVGSPSATGFLELATLGDEARLDGIVRVRVIHRCPVAEVSNRLARALGPTQQHRVGALRRTQRQLVQRDALTTRLDNPLSGRLREPQCRNRNPRHLEQTRVVRHRTHTHRRLVLLSLHEPGQP